ALASGTGAWAFTTAALANGAHSLTATATDAAGNTGVASAALGVTIDTAAPVAPAITSNAIVNLNDVALTGTAEANSTVKVFDGATLLGSATADGTGAWNYTTAGLINGTHNFTATATDVAGNTGVASAVAGVTINVAVAGTPTITSFSIDSGTIGDGITNDKSLTLTGTADANTTINVFDGGTLLGTSTADNSGAWSFLTPALADGLHNFAATAGLASGGHSLATSSISGTLAITIDATAPVSPTIASYSTDSGTLGDHITNDSTPTLTGTAEANSTVKVFDGATLLGSTVTDGAGAWSYTATALNDGVHNFTSTATDVAGNTGAASAALNLTIDTFAPTAPSIISDAIVNMNHVDLNGTAEANSLVKVYDSGTLLGSTTSDAGGSWNFVTGALNNGSHSLTAVDIDVAGNIGPASSATDVAIDASIAVSATNFTALMRGLGVLSGTSQANSSVSISDGNTGAALGHATAGANGAWSVLMGGLSYTVHNFIVTATDAAGHVGSTEAIFGTTGNDLIANSATNEVLFGNGGADTFVFGGNIGKAVVADFQANSDVVQLSHNAFSNFADVLAHAAQVGTDVTVAIDASNSVTLHNTALTQLTSNNFHIV
ncbi:MAG TPA: Ig-like domain-containing protein, partial [Pirellulales bacterium]